MKITFKRASVSCVAIFAWKENFLEVTEEFFLEQRTSYFLALQFGRRRVVFVYPSPFRMSEREFFNKLRGKK